MQFELTRGGFEIIPEGTYVFQVKSAEYDRKDRKMYVQFVTKDGQELEESWTLFDMDGNPMKKAMNAFSYLVRVLMNDESMTSLADEKLLEGRFIEGVVTHTEAESKKYPGRMNKYAHITEKKPSSGWAVADDDLGL